MKYGSLVLGLFLLLLVACGNIRLPAMRPQIGVEIVNRSSLDLENAKSLFGPYSCEWGWVIKGATKGYGFYPHPITPEAELHWDESSGHRVEKIDLRKIYPTGKSGRLTFTVFDDRVETTFKPAE